MKFLNFESKKDSALYIQAIQFARIWLGIVEVLIRRADADDKSSVDKESIAQVSKHSVADEIKKLAELHNSGILTKEEFGEQKARLLGVK